MAEAGGEEGLGALAREGAEALFAAEGAHGCLDQGLGGLGLALKEALALGGEGLELGHAHDDDAGEGVDLGVHVAGQPEVDHDQGAGDAGGRAGGEGGGQVLGSHDRLLRRGGGEEEVDPAGRVGLEVTQAAREAAVLAAEGLRALPGPVDDEELAGGGLEGLGDLAAHVADAYGDRDPGTLGAEVLADLLEGNRGDRAVRVADAGLGADLARGGHGGVEQGAEGLAAAAGGPVGVAGSAELSRDLGLAHDQAVEGGRDPEQVVQSLLALLGEEVVAGDERSPLGEEARGLEPEGLNVRQRLPLRQEDVDLDPVAGREVEDLFRAEPELELLAPRGVVGSQHEAAHAAEADPSK